MQRNQRKYFERSCPSRLFQVQNHKLVPSSHLKSVGLKLKQFVKLTEKLPNDLLSLSNKTDNISTNQCSTHSPNNGQITKNSNG
jgi:hypothetical protein